MKKIGEEKSYTIYEIFSLFNLKAKIVFATLFILLIAVFSAASVKVYQFQNKDYNMQSISVRLDTLNTEIAKLKLNIKQASRKDSLFVSSFHINAAFFEIDLTQKDTLPSKTIERALISLDSLRRNEIKDK